MKRMRLFVLGLALGLGAASTGCGGGSGACEGAKSLGDGECFQDWDKADCDAFDAKQVNGSDWVFHEGQSCKDRGYSIECPSGDWVHRSCS
ncbi:MAG TPA: hypothetical protein VN903_15810 [Polyangia bacterium]|jgi:hypothetical protein|nr:hypothetical protein [Polyangia bacterium]